MSEHEQTTRESLDVESTSVGDGLAFISAEDRRPLAESLAAGPIRSFEDVIGNRPSASASKDEAKDLRDDMKEITDQKMITDKENEDKGKDATDKGKDATDGGNGGGPPKDSDTGVPASALRLDPSEPVDPGPDEPVI